MCFEFVFESTALANILLDPTEFLFELTPKLELLMFNDPWNP